MTREEAQDKSFHLLSSQAVIMLRNPLSQERNIHPLERSSSAPSSKKGYKLDPSPSTLKIKLKRPSIPNAFMKPIKLSDDDEGEVVSVKSRSSIKSKTSLAPPSLAPPSLCSASMADESEFSGTKDEIRTPKFWATKTIGKLNCFGSGNNHHNDSSNNDNGNMKYKQTMNHYSSLVSVGSRTTMTNSSTSMMTLTEEQQRNWKSCSALPNNSTSYYTSSNDGIELIDDYSIAQSSNASMSDPLIMTSSDTNKNSSKNKNDASRKCLNSGSYNSRRRHSSSTGGGRLNNIVQRTGGAYKQRRHSTMAAF